MPTKLAARATLLLGLALQGCAYFKEPQPKGAPDLAEFPAEYIGTFTTGDQVLVIDRNSITYYMEKGKEPTKASISDSLSLRHMTPWYVATMKGKFFDGAPNFTAIAFKLDDQNHNILHLSQPDKDEILKLHPTLSKVTEPHVVSTSDNVNDPPQPVDIYDPTVDEFRKIISEQFAKQTKDKDYKPFSRQK